MDKSKELSEIFNFSIDSHFNKNPPGYRCIDLHFIHDFHFHDYYIAMLNKLYYIAFSESRDRVYNKVFFYCIDDDRFDYLYPYVKAVNEKLKIQGAAEFIVLEKVVTDSHKLIDCINNHPEKTASIIFDAERLSGCEPYFEKMFSGDFSSQEKQNNINLLNAVKMIDDGLTSNGYVVCHSGVSPVAGFEAFNVFADDIDRLSVFEFYRGGEVHQNILDTVNIAKDYLEKNHINDAKKAIENCDGIKDSHFVFIQIFNEFNDKNNKMYSLHLHKMLKDLDLESDFSVQSGLSMVKVCVGAESYPAASKILKKVAGELSTQDEIEQGIHLAEESGCREVSSDLIEKLKVHYPQSLILNYREINSAFDNEDYKQAARLFSIRDDELSKKKYKILLQLIAWVDSGAEDIVTFLKTQETSDPETVYFLNYIALKWAIKRQDYLTAIAVSLLYEAVLNDDMFIGNGEKILNEWFFNKKNPRTNEEKGRVDTLEKSMVNFVMTIFGKIFSGTINPYVRERFINVLSWENSHSIGHSILILITYNQFLLRMPTFKIVESDKFKSIPIDRVMTKIEECMAYYDEIGIVVTGKHLVPAEILTGQRDEQLAFLDELHTILIKMASSIETNSDINMINAIISIAHSAAILAEPCSKDLDIIKDVGAVLSRQGYAQAARDLAEQALQLAGDDSQRRRHAWLAAAEIYQRQSNNHPAMVYLNCAMSDNEMTIDEFFTYSNIVIRIFRDTKFIRFAYESVDFSRRTLTIFNDVLYKKNEKLYDFLELTLYFHTLCNEEVFDVEIADYIVNLAMDIALEEMSNPDNIAPILTLSLQIIEILKVNNYEIDAEFNAVIERMLAFNESSDNSDKLLNAFSVFYRESNANNLFSLYNLISSSTRYAEDRAYDDHPLHFYAAVLLRRNPDMSLRDRAFSAELLTDSSYSLHSEYLYSNPYPRYQRIEEPDEYASAYALNNNVAVYMLVLDDYKKGTLLCWLPGSDGAVIDPSLWHFDFAKFHKWKKEFPYEYGFYDSVKTPNLFFDSTEFIRFDFDFHGKSVLILDVMLQSLVPNLIQLQSGLAGTLAAISCAPSLVWLEQTSSSPVKTNGKRVSWISTAGSEGQTLKAMADEFSQEDGVFAKWDVKHNGDSALPVEFENSELVIIGAHGGVTDSEHVFRSISDEGTLRVNFSTFSSRLRQCGVVILFVCSSGRFDNHPEAATTIGLAKELIDNGCTAVVSSPWPLDPMMTMKWLPLFMESWMSGATVSEAVFVANKELTNYYSYDYSKCIALSVFGDGSRQYQKP
ncbi:CHAT domain-containing protein [Pseudomonas graminis]